jgi:hypothetical protein
MLRDSFSDDFPSFLILSTPLATRLRFSASNARIAKWYYFQIQSAQDLKSKHSGANFPHGYPAFLSTVEASITRWR